MPPAVPVYWRCTPTVCVLFFRSPVSSTTRLRADGRRAEVGHRAAQTHHQLGLFAAWLRDYVAPLLDRIPVPEGMVTVPVQQPVQEGLVPAVGTLEPHQDCVHM
ncbi:hypothetical protein GCM10009646_68460 [Streptomyces aureus]